MLQWKFPPSMILLCLLCSWNTILKHEVDRDFCEVFAGRGAVTEAFRNAHMRGAAIDVDINARVFDLTTPAGFVLTLNEILRCKPGSMVLLAPCCKSFSRMCRHTSGRSSFRPWGNVGYVFVRTGNILGCRVCLLILVCCYKGLRWLLEQPSGSCFHVMPRFQIILELLDVWSGRFWMGRFNSLSPKPHVMYSNDKGMILLLCRKAGYMSREEAQKCPVRTSRTYLDSRGQKRCVGRKKELRESQFYTPEFGQFVLEMVQSRAGEPVPGPPNPPALDVTMTDLELFRHHCMDLGDKWPEAKLMDAVLYLARCKHMQIPHGWDRVLHDLGLRSMNV